MKQDVESGNDLLWSLWPGGEYHILVLHGTKFCYRLVSRIKQINKAGSPIVCRDTWPGPSTIVPGTNKGRSLPSKLSKAMRQLYTMKGYGV